MNAPAWVDCGGVRLERGVRCRMSDGVELVSDHYYPAAPDQSHAPDAPALRPRYRLHRRLRAPGLVRAAWLQRRDSGCARPGRFGRLLLSFPQRRPRRRGDDCLASHPSRIEWPHRHVRLFLSGNDAVARRGRTARGASMHRAGDDRPRSVSRLVLSPRRAAVGLRPGLGNTDAQGRRAPPQAARSQRPTGTGLGESPLANGRASFSRAPRHSRRGFAAVRARLVRP